jgi:hypothetical protein
MKTAKTRNFLKITAGLTLALLLWKNTGRVKSVYIECHKTKGEQLALQLLIESFEITRWFQREYYEVHITGDNCATVYNYYPRKKILSYASDPCSGFGGVLIVSETELINLKKQSLTYDQLYVKFKRPASNLNLDIPNSLCDIL